MALSKDSSEDRYLVNLVLKGDNKAYAIIVRNTERLVTQIVCKMLREGEDRKDIAQDIYLKAYNGLAGFTFRSSLSTWIAQIAYNTCLNHLEKRKDILTGDLDQDPGFKEEEADVVLFPFARAAGKEADQVILDKQRSFIIRQAIESLSPLQRTLITLYHQEDQPYEEIASITNLPIGTVKNYLFRARRSMKDYLLRHYKKEEL